MSVGGVLALMNAVVLALSCPADIAVAVAVMEIPVVIDDAPSADNQDAAVGSLRTTGMIARELGVEIHRVLFLIRTRKIPPSSRAGHYRMFDDTAVHRVSAELRKAATET